MLTFIAKFDLRIYRIPYYFNSALTLTAAVIAYFYIN